MVFKTKEDELNFVKDFDELLNMETEWNEEKIHIDFAGRVDLSLVDIESLDDFVAF